MRFLGHKGEIHLVTQITLDVSSLVARSKKSKINQVEGMLRLPGSSNNYIKSPE